MDLWVNKYLPKTPRQIVGNAKAVKHVYDWISNFQKNQKVKILLLIGKSGVGKTSTVTAVANVLNQELIEFNASDTRSPKMLKELLFDTGSLKSYFNRSNDNTFGKSISGQKQIILMDEVDGMQPAAVTELIALSAGAKWPIVCICNYETTAVRKLSSHSEKVWYYPVPVATIVTFAQSILKKECGAAARLSEEDLADIAEYTGGDIRRTINEMQFICTHTETPDCALGGTFGNTQVSEDTIFNMVQKLINGDLTIDQMMQYYFLDSFMVPLFVQENYIHACKGNGTLSRVADIAESLSLANTVEREIYQYQHFALEPVRACLSTVIPVSLMNREVQRLNFPMSLGKGKTQEKNEKFIRIMKQKSKGIVNDETAYHLTLIFYYILKNCGGDSSKCVNLVVDLITKCNLNIDDFKELFVLTQNEELYSSLETKVKSAITREYKKRVDGGGNKKRKVVVVPSSADNVDDGDNDHEDQEDYNVDEGYW